LGRFFNGAAELLLGAELYALPVAPAILSPVFVRDRVFNGAIISTPDATAGSAGDLVAGAGKPPQSARTK
jgi:hypothetical protein